MFRLLKTAFLAFAVAPAVCYGQIYDIDKGKLEFIGLKKWTPEKIMQVLGYKSFNEMHACAADLKYRLGFPDAAVIISYTPDKKLHFLVSAVEPQEQARVSFTEPWASVITPDDWFTMTKQATVEPNQFADGLRDIFRQSTKLPEDAPPVKPQGWWNDLKKLSRESDFKTAVKAAMQDRDPTDRMVGCAVLSNFPERDETWHTLMAVVRDPDNMTRRTAESMLDFMAQAKPRKVDWKPAVAHIRYILNGTNLFALPAILRVLSATQLDPALAKALVGNGGGQMLLEYLKVRREGEPELAQALLKRLSGQDYGRDVEKWTAWRDGLK